MFLWGLVLCIFLSSMAIVDMGLVYNKVIVLQR